MRGPGPNGAAPPAGRGGPAQRGGQSYKQAAGGRNAPQTQAPAAAAPAGPTITAEALASAGPAEQKQMLGEALYPRIHESVPHLAGVSVLNISWIWRERASLTVSCALVQKITGMLLEMDNSELLHLLENEEALSGKVTEAIQVLEEVRLS